MDDLLPNLKYQNLPNLSYLDRPYQRNCLSNILTMADDRGRIIMPTASGKTFMAALTLFYRLGTRSRVHLVIAPRIALVNQHMREYRDVIAKEKGNTEGKKYLAYAFHSGKTETDYTTITWKEENGTNPNEIEHQIARADRLKMDLIIFTTYHSYGRLVNYDFTTVIFDESQYCVSETGFEHIMELDSDLTLFFTATEKRTVSSSGRGLNNEDVYGEIVYQVAPQPLIDLGYILAPKLHIMMANAADDNVLLDEICSIASKQIELAHAVPIRKVLFAMKGTADVRDVIRNRKVIEARIPGYNIYTIVSNVEYGAQINGVKCTRDEFMKALDVDTFALVFHYDILSEGIDIDGFTGVAILRNMDHAKVLQTIGRAQRVYKPDRLKEIWQRDKKWAYVSCKVINGNYESAEYLRGILKMIRDAGFEVNSKEIDFTDEDGFGINEDDVMDSPLRLSKKEKAWKFLYNVLHDVETEERMHAIRRLTDLELVEGMSHD